MCVYITPLLSTCSSFFILSPFRRSSVREFCLSCHSHPLPPFLVLYVDAFYENTEQNMLVYVLEAPAPRR